MMHFRLFAILLLLVAGSTTVVSGQTQQEPTLDMEFTDIPLSEAISRIEKNTRYTFFYDAKQTDLSQHVSLKAKRMPISAALKEMLAPTGLNFTITERQIALIPARKSPARQRTITGVVNDSSETPLAGVAVTLVGDNTRGAVTEANGSFTLTVPDADITLSFTYLGYVSKKVAVPATQNNVKVFLTEDAVKMEDVVVVGYGTQKKVNLTAPSPRWTKNSCRTGRRLRWPTCCKAPSRDSRSRLRRDARAIRPASTSAASPRSTAVRRWCWSTAPKAT